MITTTSTTTTTTTTNHNNNNDNSNNNNNVNNNKDNHTSNEPGLTPRWDSCSLKSGALSAIGPGKRRFIWGCWP